MFEVVIITTAISIITGSSGTTMNSVVTRAIRIIIFSPEYPL